MNHPHPVTGWRRVGYLTLAGIFFLLGTIGLILPGLPTTPFLLLTSFFLIRSYPSLNRRLLQSRLFGPLILDWQQHRGIRWHIKVKTVALVLIVLSLSLYFGQLSTPLKLGVVGLVALGLTVVLRLPTVPADAAAHLPKSSRSPSPRNNASAAHNTLASPIARGTLPQPSNLRRLGRQHSQPDESSR